MMRLMYVGAGQATTMKWRILLAGREQRWRSVGRVVACGKVRQERREQEQRCVVRSAGTVAGSEVEVTNAVIRSECKKRNREEVVNFWLHLEY
jgi:hypothetical protein